MQQIIQPFDINNLSQIVEFVKPMWTFSGWEESFRKFYAETILRNNYLKNDFEQWLLKNSANFDEQKKESSKLCAEYLLYMDSKVHHLMKDDDIKLMYLN